MLAFYKNIKFINLVNIMQYQGRVGILQVHKVCFIWEKRNSKKSYVRVFLFNLTVLEACYNINCCESFLKCQMHDYLEL